MKNDYAEALRVSQFLHFDHDTYKLLFEGDNSNNFQVIDNLQN